MTAFPDDYKKALLAHTESVVEVARVLVARNPDLTMTEACAIVGTAHTDATISLIFNTFSFSTPKKPK